MHHQNETRRAGGAAGLGNSPCLAADGSENIHSQSAPQEAIAALRRDFAAEALRVAAIKATHAAIVTSLALQFGADLETIRNALTKDHDGGHAALLGAALDALLDDRAGAP